MQPVYLINSGTSPHADVRGAVAASSLRQPMDDRVNPRGTCSVRGTSGGHGLTEAAVRGVTWSKFGRYSRGPDRKSRRSGRA
jgi:hypothetical protein